MFWSVFIPLVLIYVATLQRGFPYNIDSFTNVLTASALTERGTFFLDDYEQLTDPPYFGNVAWLVAAANGHTVSMYPPGAAFLAAPLYLLAPPGKRQAMRGGNSQEETPAVIEVPPVWPGSLAATLATAAAAGILAVAVASTATNTLGIFTGYVLGLGTSAWSIASDALWQHGPAMMWIGLALLLLSKERHTSAGIAFGLSVLTRPHTAFIAAAAGIHIAITRRSFRPAVLIGLGSGVGFGALIAYNWLVFGVPSISGGYGPTFAGRLLTSEPLWYLKNVALALVDPQRGLLIWAPFLIVLSPGMSRAWKSAPTWVRGAAIGGVLYLLVQLRANSFAASLGPFGYRYPLEALVAGTPILAWSFREWVTLSPLRIRIFVAALALAVAGQAIGAVLY